MMEPPLPKVTPSKAQTVVTATKKATAPYAMVVVAVLLITFGYILGKL